MLIFQGRTPYFLSLCEYVSRPSCKSGGGQRAKEQVEKARMTGNGFRMSPSCHAARSLCSAISPLHVAQRASLRGRRSREWRATGQSLPAAQWDLHAARAGARLLASKYVAAWKWGAFPVQFHREWGLGSSG